MTAPKSVRRVSIKDLPLWKKTFQSRTLLDLTLELTARCNNACSHCYVNLPANDAAGIKKELTFSEIKSIIDQAVDLGCLWAHLTGGEPLLRKDFKQIYLYLKQKGLLITLFTNASLISKAHIELFRQYPPRNIEVSVYGVTEKTHKKVTQKNWFKQSLNGIDQLIRASIPVTLKSTILRANVKELDQISAWCRDKSNQPFRFDPFLHLRTDRDEKRNADIRSQRLGARQIVALERKDVLRFDALKKKCAALSGTRENEDAAHTLLQCGAGINSGCVSYDGMFRLCSSLCHSQCIYDLRTGTLSDAWHRFTPGIRAKTSDGTVFKENCMSCNIKPLCLCCPAHADLETGKLDGHVPYFCDMANQRFKNSLE